MTTTAQPRREEALLIALDDHGLDDAIYEAYDVSTLEDLLSEKIELDGTGELDGHDIGPAGTTIYLYGPNAEKLFSCVQPILSSYPLCRNSRVVIRRGGPGSTTRETAFPFSQPPTGRLPGWLPFRNRFPFKR